MNDDPLEYTDPEFEAFIDELVQVKKVESWNDLCKEDQKKVIRLYADTVFVKNCNDDGYRNSIMMAGCITRAGQFIYRKAEKIKG